MFLAEAFDADGANVGALFFLRSCPIGLIDTRWCATHTRRTAGLAGALRLALVLTLAGLAFTFALALAHAAGETCLLCCCSHGLRCGVQSVALITTSLHCGKRVGSSLRCGRGRFALAFAFAFALPFAFALAFAFALGLGFTFAGSLALARLLAFTIRGSRFGCRFAGTGGEFLCGFAGGFGRRGTKCSESLSRTLKIFTRLLSSLGLGRGTGRR